MTKKVVFLHIRKTAGTSFRTCLAKNFDAKAECPIRSQFELRAKFAPNARRNELDKYNFISGHFYDLNSFLSDNHCITFMFFRNPIDRVISAFNHMKNDTRDPLHKFVSNVSLSEALDSDQVATEMSNSQFRYLFGNFYPNFEYSAFHATSDFKALEADISACLTKVTHIGLTEFYRSSLKLFSKTCPSGLLFGRPEHRNKDITSNGMKLESLSSEQLEKIISYNKLDMLVYKQACRLFDKSTAENL